MTMITQEEGFNALASLDVNKIEDFLEDWKKGYPDTECKFYDDLYEPLTRVHFTDYGEDSEEICNGEHFWQDCAKFSDGLPSCIYEFAKVVDTTGF